MQKLVATALLALACSALPAPPVRAWGFTAHRFIGDRAVDLLPPEIRPFFEKYRATFVEHTIDPDTYRTMGWAEEPPRHFMNLDAYGPFPFRDLPHDYRAAVAARGAAFVTKNGLLPWRTEEVYDQLRDAFRQVQTAPYARDNVKLFASVIAHYVADAHQPFHAASNYDGRITGQRGIHARFETELFERYQDTLAIAPPPAVPIPSAHEFVFAALADGFAAVQPILDADREAIRGRASYDDGYFAALFRQTRPILEQRIARSISGVASLIAQAWVDAGRPPVPPDAPPRSPRPIRR